MATKSPTSPNVTWRERWKINSERAADLGRRVRFYFTGDGQSQAGMAALTGTLAGTRQGMISSPSKMNRKRIALVFRCCNARIRSAGDADLPRKIARSGALSSRPPEILLTHPLPESRLAEPATVLIRCARWWCSRRKISTGESAHTGDV